MTEAEWVACESPAAMLQELFNDADRDKLRLLACRLCLMPEIRRLLETQRAGAFIAAAELYAAGQSDWDALRTEIRRAPQAKASGGSWRAHNPVRLAPSAQALRTVAALGADDSWDAAAGVVRDGVNLLGPETCDVIRELFPAPPT